MGSRRIARQRHVRRATSDERRRRRRNSVTRERQTFCATPWQGVLRRRGSCLRRRLALQELQRPRSANAGEGRRLRPSARTTRRRPACPPPAFAALSGRTSRSRTGARGHRSPKTSVVCLGRTGIGYAVARYPLRPPPGRGASGRCLPRRSRQVCRSGRIACESPEGSAANVGGDRGEGSCGSSRHVSRSAPFLRLRHPCAVRLPGKYGTLCPEPSVSQGAASVSTTPVAGRIRSPRARTPPPASPRQRRTLGGWAARRARTAPTPPRG